MPQVPRYEPNQIKEQITPRVQSNINVSREALGGGQSSAEVFKAASGLAEQAYKYEIAARERVSDAETFEYDGQLSIFQNNLQNQIKTNYQGKKAVDAGKFATEEWQKGSAKILEQVKDPVAKAKLTASASKRYSELFNSVGDFSTQQLLAHEESTYKSYVQNMRDDGVSNYADPEKLNGSLARQQAAIAAWAEHKGLSNEEMRAQLTEAESKTHLGVITRMVNEDKDMGAKQYLDKIKDKIAGPDKDAAMKLVETATLRGESQRKAGEIVGKATDMADAVERARQIQDPELQDETLTRVKKIYEDRKAAERNSVEDLHRRAADVIDRTGSIDSIPKEDWVRFSQSERAGLKSYAENRSKGTQPETSWPDYYELKTMAAGDKSKFNNVNLMTYRGKMADAEFKELVGLQTGSRGGKPDEKLLDGYRTDSMIVNDSLKAAGYEPNPKKGSRDAESVAKFRATVDMQMRQMQERTGKKASNEDVQRIVDNLLVEVVTKPGMIFDTKKRAFELDPGEGGAVKIDDVPKIERRMIEDALRRRNKPITESAILELYTRKLQGS